VKPPPLVLDDHQRTVVDRVARAGHGPMLVLAGPGTGKTTTLVEAIAARVEAGTAPERILTLTFSRRAAGELRTRIAQRIQRTVAAPLAWTFHGFGFSLVGQLLVPDDLGRGLRLLSGQEQEVVVRELLANDRDLGVVPWPPELDAALQTRGFTEQVRTFMSTARSLGLDSADVANLAPGRSDWAALASFMSEYLDVIDSRGVLDYSELVIRAVAFAESVDGRRRLREAYDLVVVDEYQDTDPAQERLLHAIAGDGRDLLVVGDPDQSIYGFRGADVRGITEFADRFRTSRGEQADILTLRTSRRCPAAVLEASRRVADLLGPAGSLPTTALREHRALTAPESAVPGEVSIRLYPTVENEARAIAEVLRREHLQSGTPWSDMAVLVRSGVTAVPVLERALAASGVPIEVALDELPLRDHPTLSPLMTLLGYAVSPDTFSAADAHELLTAPIGGASPTEVRRLGRALREARREVGQSDPEPSSELVRQALIDGSLLEALPAAATGRARALADLLATMRRAHAEGWSAHETLWAIWHDSPWALRLADAASAAGQGADEANRALDAVVALFDLASRSRQRSPRSDLATFLAEVSAQEIPAGPLSDGGVRGDGVRIMTAHRSKGLEWDVVVVAGVQADEWPDLRRRSSVLDSDLLGHDGLRPPLTVADIRREERRLFYVAITRARRRVLCTAVQTPSDEGLRPSSFLDDLEVSMSFEGLAVRHPLTLAGVVAELRSTLVDPSTSDALRCVAADRLARLAEEGERDAPLVRAAHPQQWWGVHAWSDADAEPLPVAEVMHLSGSQIETIHRCPLQWYLSRRVAAESGRGAAAGFGGLLHALADAVARGDQPAELGPLVTELDEVWGQLPYPAAWEASGEHDQAVLALERFLRWHDGAREREVVASEESFEATFSVAGHELRLTGRLDRLERDSEGGLVVVDLKTMRAAPSKDSVAGNLQLATYRRLVAGDGRFGDSVSGAELVQLRIPAGARDPGPKVQRQDATPEADAALDEALHHAVTTIASGAFPATPGTHCSYCPFTVTCPAQAEGREVIS
jgi:superfamily I DNA/RNA helicase/RecB family exonuclease